MEPGARSLDVQESLPLVDVHSLDVASPPEQVWRALLNVIRGFRANRAASVAATALGCGDRRSTGPFPAVESSMPGFHLVRSTAPEEMTLEGEHRFARYRLTFRIQDLGPAGSRLHAESRAEFPGPVGTLYRALVVGSGGHVIAVRQILRLVARTARRTTTSTADGSTR
ncbi:MAG TPA: hypothetical protein VGR90_05650 [Acidimicrobiales bacterium]|nr:hypothetical protein [Acidimicrobiales bacterium]